MDSDDLEQMSRLTLFKLKLINNLEDWHRDGEVTKEELDRFKSNALNLWDTQFRLEHVGTISEEEYNKKGIEVLRNVLKQSLKFTGQDLDVDMCNGKFYSLSDEPIIGWRKDWGKHKK